ncbi:fatty acid synthase-like [Diorhabda carinulata]|uniref:fatty acid synthase-like n=1 Tax=Diorhabda carinulata TaxID=1163345 RepID=UPI0025A0E82F|nr:fatty acid synthase-like [Diorhabda carinulata]
MESPNDIVITGFAGRYPECDNAEEFKEALLAGVNLITDDDRRFPVGTPNIPIPSGKLRNLDKFDAEFFGLSFKQYNYMDPRHRIILETTFEAIIDAGYNPSELRGTNTGVFVGISIMHPGSTPDDPQFPFYLMISMYHCPNTISYCFDFKGPSLAVDTGCSASMYAFALAYEKLKSGEIEHAIVGGAHIALSPAETREYAVQQVLSWEGKSRVFGEERDGFVRSEIVCTYLLQKRCNSRRVYATVLGSKTNVDGYKSQGPSFPSGEMQCRLMKEIYFKANINIDDVSYVEMHGTGTQAGDREEARALSIMFAKKKQPLLIGSVKSNMGHCEAGAGLANMSKVMIAFETGVIPKNINWEPLDTTIPGINDGSLKVVTSNTDYQNGLVGINSFGLFGANAHTVLKPAPPKIKTPFKYQHRLVHVSGRTEESVSSFLDELQKCPLDEECFSLLDEIHKCNIDGHDYRGYTVLGSSNVKEIEKYSSGKRPIWFIYSGMGSQWIGMGKQFMHIEVFRESIERCSETLEPYGIDLLKLIMEESKVIMDDSHISTCGVIAIQIALTNLLSSLGIKPDYFAGHSVGEIACGYANGDLSIEQTISLAYGRGYAIKQATCPEGQMAAVGLSKEDLESIIPDDIYMACFNSEDSTTISGPKNSTRMFVQKLTEKGIFARLVNSGNIAFHTPYLNNADKYYLDFVNTIIKDPKPRSECWISTSVPPEKKGEHWTKYNCAEYYASNFRNQVFFKDIFKQIHKNAIIVEIGPHALLQAILRRAKSPESTLIGLVNKTSKDQEEYLLSSIGKIFNAGAQPNLRNLYNEIQFPVRRGTKMLAPLIRWNHSASYYVPLFENKRNAGKNIVISLSDAKYAYLYGHNIDGRILMPATGYLELVWSVFSEINLKKHTKMPVIFENVGFVRAVVLSENANAEFAVNIMKSGNFEVTEKGSVVATGKIREAEDIDDKFTPQDIFAKSKDKINTNDDYPNKLKHDDIYKELFLRRYCYEGLFRGIYECNFDGSYAKLQWNNNFTAFMDCMVQLMLIERKNRDLVVPTSIKKIIINPTAQTQYPKDTNMEVFRNACQNIIKTKGIELYCPQVTVIPRRKKIQSNPYLESYEFVPYNSLLNTEYNYSQSLHIALSIILQNVNGIVKTISIAEIEVDDITTDKTVIEQIKNFYSGKILVVTKFSKLKPPFNNEFDILVVNDILLKTYREEIKSVLNKEIFIVCTGNLISENLNDYEIVFQTASLTLLRLKSSNMKYADAIEVKNHELKWVDKLREICRNEPKETVVVYSQNEVTSGILGLVINLQVETRTPFKAFMIDQDKPKFSLTEKYYQNQLSKNLCLNVLRDNVWGTFVTFPFEDKRPVSTLVDNALISIHIPGDISSLNWTEAPSIERTLKADEIVNTNYLALNFNDVMKAMGKMNIGETNEMLLGCEYSGVTEFGKKVMGIIEEPVRLRIRSDPYFTWEVPKAWSLAEAATVPVAYIKSYYGLIVKAGMERNESILIHSGSRPMGIAAIRLALGLNATVFTTVSTEEKKQFLLKLFPQLNHSHIGSSNDGTFYNMIKSETRGRGVDIILNTLTGELFQTTLNCLAKEGRFVETNKMNLNNENDYSNIIINTTSFIGLNMYELHENMTMKMKIHKLLNEGIVSGVVQPIPHTVYESDDLQTAFNKFPTTIGKVLIQIKKDVFQPLKIPIQRRLFLNCDKVYIIIGGLGGMGLELAHWLFSRGAHKIILNGRRGVWNGYQAYCLNNWSQLGYKAIVDLNDSTTMVGTEKLIDNAKKYGPVGGIFHSAATLRDAPITEQTQQNFEEVFKPKIVSCENLDQVTRKKCPELDFYVVFSSQVSTRGLLGQANYAFANSSLEKICEKRRMDNLPSLAMQWGPIADVGIIADKFHSMTIYNLENQRIESCWETLETFMLNKDVVVGVPTVFSTTAQSDKKKGSSPVETVAHVLGIKSAVKDIDQNKTLAQFGIDSLMSAEVKQIIFQNFKVDMLTEDIAKLTFADLNNLMSRA